VEPTTKKWAIGCGIGCGAVVVLCLVLIILGVFFLKDMVTSFEETGELTKSLNELYGEVDDFAPSLDGRIPYERMQAFLYVRDQLGPARDSLSETIDFLESVGDQNKDEKGRRIGVAIRAIKAGFGLIPQIGEYYTRRSRALLEVEMGLGEYLYIYILSYYSMLGKSPGEGPGFRLMQGDVKWGLNDWNREDNLEERNSQMTERVHAFVLAMLKNLEPQLDVPSSNPDEEEWKGIFLSEIQILEANPLRIPWQDGLPFVIEASLRPFLSRLENTYSPQVNVLELVQE